MLDSATVRNAALNLIQGMASQAQNAYKVTSQYMGRTIVWINAHTPPFAQKTFQSSQKVAGFITPYLASVANFVQSGATHVFSFAAKHSAKIGITGACAIVAGWALNYFCKSIKTNPDQPVAGQPSLAQAALGAESDAAAPADANPQPPVEVAAPVAPAAPATE